MTLKEKMMDKMMDSQFSNMSPEEKQKMMEAMMDSFLSGMSDEEKRKMMENMMPRMMAGMGGGKNENPMMGMMMGMMGNKGKDKKMPWDMCKEMMTGISETASSAKFATAELRGLFEEWCTQVQTEILESIKKDKKVDVKAIATEFNLSDESTRYLLGRLASKNLIKFEVEESIPD